MGGRRRWSHALPHPHPHSSALLSAIAAAAPLGAVGGAIAGPASAGGIVTAAASFTAGPSPAWPAPRRSTRAPCAPPVLRLALAESAVDSGRTDGDAHDDERERRGADTCTADMAAARATSLR